MEWSHVTVKKKKNNNKWVEVGVTEQENNNSSWQ